MSRTPEERVRSHMEKIATAGNASTLHKELHFPEHDYAAAIWTDVWTLAKHFPGAPLRAGVPAVRDEKLMGLLKTATWNDFDMKGWCMANELEADFSDIVAQLWRVDESYEAGSIEDLFTAGDLRRLKAEPKETHKDQHAYLEDAFLAQCNVDARSVALPLLSDTHDEDADEMDDVPHEDAEEPAAAASSSSAAAAVAGAATASVPPGLPPNHPFWIVRHALLACVCTRVMDLDTKRLSIEEELKTLPDNPFTDEFLRRYGLEHIRNEIPVPSALLRRIQLSNVQKSEMPTRTDRLALGTFWLHVARKVNDAMIRDLDQKMQKAFAERSSFPTDWVSVTLPPTDAGPNKVSSSSNRVCVAMVADADRYLAQLATESLWAMCTELRLQCARGVEDGDLRAIATSHDTLWYMLVSTYPYTPDQSPTDIIHDLFRVQLGFRRMDAECTKELEQRWTTARNQYEAEEEKKSKDRATAQKTLTTQKEVPNEKQSAAKATKAAEKAAKAAEKAAKEAATAVSDVASAETTADDKEAFSDAAKVAYDAATVAYKKAEEAANAATETATKAKKAHRKAGTASKNASKAANNASTDAAAAASAAAVTKTDKATKAAATAVAKAANAAEKAAKAAEDETEAADEEAKTSKAAEDAGSKAASAKEAFKKAENAYTAFVNEATKAAANAAAEAAHEQAKQAAAIAKATSANANNAVKKAVATNENARLAVMIAAENADKAASDAVVKKTDSAAKKATTEASKAATAAKEADIAANEAKKAVSEAEKTSEAAKDAESKAALAKAAFTKTKKAYKTAADAVAKVVVAMKAAASVERLPSGSSTKDDVPTPPPAVTTNQSTTKPTTSLSAQRTQAVTPISQTAATTAAASSSAAAAAAAATTDDSPVTHVPPTKRREKTAAQKRKVDTVKEALRGYSAADAAAVADDASAADVSADAPGQSRKKPRVENLSSTASSSAAASADMSLSAPADSAQSPPDMAFLDISPLEEKTLWDDIGRENRFAVKMLNTNLNGLREQTDEVKFKLATAKIETALKYSASIGAQSATSQEELEAFRNSHDGTANAEILHQVSRVRDGNPIRACDLIRIWRLVRVRDSRQPLSTRIELSTILTHCAERASTFDRDGKAWFEVIRNAIVAWVPIVPPSFSDHSLIVSTAFLDQHPLLMRILLLMISDLYRLTAGKKTFVLPSELVTLASSLLRSATGAAQ